jgi:TANFOR domain-containing protein
MKNKIFFFSFLFITQVLTIQAQFPVNVTLQLIPPYSTRLSDYANNPGKTVIILRNTQPRVLTVYLRASITGDNGIQIFTNANYRAARGITLQPNIPYTLTIGDLQDVFDINQLNTRGITVNDIERKNGLPEGTYQVCVRAYDFTRQNTPLSGEDPLGCTTVRLTQLEPPITIKPYDEEEVKALQPQNVIFSWTVPAGAPPATQYQLKIIEMFDPKRNPNDAFLSATQPPFFEKIVSGNVYVFGPADPTMVAGRKYAWAVTALDRVNQGNRVASQGTAFRNGGRSEIKSFIYKKDDFKPITAPEVAVAPKKEEKKSTKKTVPSTVFTPKIDIPNLTILNTSVKGRLLYAYPEDYSMEKFGNSSRVAKGNYQKKSLKKGTQLFDLPYYSSDAYLNTIPAAKPLGKVKVSLVMVYVDFSKNLSMPTYPVGGVNILTTFPNTDLLNYSVNGQPFNEASLSKVLATTYTNDNGEFNFSFIQKDTCKVMEFKVKEKDKVYTTTDEYGNYKEIITTGATSTQSAIQRTCVLVVESPYYCSPVMLINPSPGDNIILPDQVSLVKSFELVVRTENDEKIAQLAKEGASIENIHKGAKLENINVELFRMKPTDVTLPLQEGQNLPLSSIQSLKMGDYANAYPVSQVAKVVALGKTDAEGKLGIPRVIKIGSSKQDIFVAHTYTSATTGVYNMFDGIKKINDWGNNEIGSAGFPGGFDDFLIFNSSYNYDKIDYYLIMKAKLPKVLGKATENTKGLPGVNVALTNRQEDIIAKMKQSIESINPFSSGTSEETPMMDYPVGIVTTDKDGYFEFKDLKPADYKLFLTKSGYKDKKYKENDTPFTLQNGQLLQLNDLEMKPTGKITLCVKDEEGNKIISDVQVDDGAFYVTDKSGLFQGCVTMPAPSGTGRKLKIYPRSEEYFEEIYTIDVKDAGNDGLTVIDKSKSTVYRRKHRMKFIVKGKQAGSNETISLENATVEIKSQGIKVLTNGNGEALVQFESPGKNFLVKVRPEKGSDWSYFENEINIPVNKTPKSQTITLEQAHTLVANVTSEKDGKPLKGAKVYIKKLKKYWDNNTANYAECTTDEKGSCTLKGIPTEENNIEVFASKNNTDGVTYIGGKQEAFWFNGQFQTKVDFKLKAQEGFVVKNIWGFPIEIEEAKSVGSDAFEVSGSILNLPGSSDFNLIDPNTRLDFKSIKFVKSAGDPNNTHQPESKSVITNQLSIPIRIGSKLQGKANGFAQADLNKNLKIAISKGTDGKAEIRTPVLLELSSFEGAYQLSGKMELSDAINKNNALVFKAISTQQTSANFNGQSISTAVTNINEKKKYFVGQMAMSGSGFNVKNLKYKVHSFEAESIASQSYLYSDSVKLFTILHTNIPDMVPADIALQAGYITILPDKIVPFSGGNTISFSLEKWKVTGLKVDNTAQAWQYDNNNGGIIIPKVAVNTGIISVSLKNLIIKPDKLIADKLEIQKGDNALTLGGFVPLTVDAEATYKFGYDPNCYHDGKPHWKLSLLSGVNKSIAATVSNLDGLEDGQKIEFGSMNIFSDNQQQLNGASTKNLVFRKVLNFSLNTIDVQADNFTLVGQASMNIPNMSNKGGGISGQIMYSKGSGGKAIFEFKPIPFNIEGKGQVSFQAQDAGQQLTSGKFVALGTMKVSDGPSGKSFNLLGRLIHQKTNSGFDTYIEVRDDSKMNDQKFPLDTKHLNVKSGIANSGMKVINNQWDNLRLKTVLPIGNNGFEMLSEKEELRTLTLVVKGAIETDPSSGMVGLKGMDTGVGSISLFYDFPRGELRGNFFFLPPVPVNMGLVNLTSSNISMAIGKSGFFMMCNGTGDIALPGGLPLPVSSGLNYIAGYYTTPLPPEDVKTLITLSVKKSLPSFFQSGVKGMYSSVNINSTPFDEGFNYGIEDVASVGCWAKAGAAYEYRNFVNFNSLTNFTVASGNYAYAFVDAGGSAEILGIGVSGSAHVDFQAALEQSVTPDIGFSMANIKSTLNSITLMGCASVGVSFSLEACVLGECLGGTVSKDVSARFGIENGSPKLNFSFDSCGNGMPAMKLNDSGY